MLAATGLGLAPLAKKAALDAGAAPLVLAWSTVASAAVIAVLALGRLEGFRALRAPSRAALRHVFVVGALSSGAVVLLGILAMTGTSATNRGLFQAMYPVATAIAARLLLGERLPGRAYAVILGMTAGLLLMNVTGEGARLGVPFLLLLATLPMIGIADVYAKRTLEGADAAFVTVGRLVAGALVLALALPLAPAEHWARLLEAWPWVLAAGLAVAVGLLGLYRAMDATGASLAAAFAGLAPVLTLAGEWALLGTAFGTAQLLGVALVVAGAVVLARLA